MTKPHRPRPSPAAAAESTDAESGTEEDSARRSLYALDVMLQRGLIDEAEYRRRRAAINDAGSSGA